MHLLSDWNFEAYLFVLLKNSLAVLIQTSSSLICHHCDSYIAPQRDCDFKKEKVYFLYLKIQSTTKRNWETPKGSWSRDISRICHNKFNPSCFTTYFPVLVLPKVMTIKTQAILKWLSKNVGWKQPNFSVLLRTHHRHLPLWELNGGGLYSNR
jgi:hypothetical protein